MDDPQVASDGNRYAHTATAAGEAIEQATMPFVGRWNQLVSTTNWEKGRIIWQWREALTAAGVAAAQYSDEAWSRRVGGVTGQHVGRLRRVYQRFGRSYEQYEGLYWSHFQAALDWEDAEMWLEGAVQSHWSVTQMRRQRWETLGAVPQDRPRDEDVVSAELDEDFEPAVGQEPGTQRITGSYEEVQGPRREGPDFGEESERPASKRPSRPDTGQDGAAIYAEQREDIPSVKFVRPFENLADLPSDLAEAFEAYKLAILTHKAAGWQQVSCEDVLASLDALKELALAPSADHAPF